MRLIDAEILLSRIREYAEDCFNTCDFGGYHLMNSLEDFVLSIANGDVETSNKTEI